MVIIVDDKSAENEKHVHAQSAALFQRLGYIRVVPCDEAEQQMVQEDAERRPERRPVRLGSSAGRLEVAVIGVLHVEQGVQAPAERVPRHAS